MKGQSIPINKRIEEMLDLEGKNKGDGGEEEEILVEINEASILKMNPSCKDLSAVQSVRLIGVRVVGLDKLDSFVPQLKYLNVSFTRVERMAGTAKMKELKEAILCHNLFDEIRALDDCKQLLTLDLSHNRISEITGLNSLLRLTKLNLAGNQISLIQNLDGLKSLTSLNLGSNRIKKIDFFPSLPNLEDLNLQDNLIEMVHPKLFENLQTITELNLTKNKLRSLEFLNQLSNLEKLGCGSNCLEKITLKTVLEEMEFLDFSDNQITEINRFEEFFPNLFSLDISKNSICLECEFDFIYGMDALCEINFSENPVFSPEFLTVFKRKHPQLDFVNGDTVHPAGHRFREEITQVSEEIIELENTEKRIAIKNKLAEVAAAKAAGSSTKLEMDVGGSETIEDDPTASILKAHNITDLETLLQQFKKEEDAEKLATQAFISYYKHLNEEITVEEIHAEREKRKQRELFGEQYLEEKQDNQLSVDASRQGDNQEEEDNDDDEDGDSDSDDDMHSRVRRYNHHMQGGKQQDSRKSALMKHFEAFATLADENTLEGFLTELQKDFGSIRAKYQAIKGMKHLKRHNSMHNISTVEKSGDDSFSDLENSSGVHNDILNTSTSSLKSRGSISKLTDKNIIIKKVKTPIPGGISNSLRGSLVVPSFGTSTTILSNSRGAAGLQNTMNLPQLPPRNTTLQKELRDFKKNLNDNEFLKRIGMSSTQSNNSSTMEKGESNLTRTLKAPATGGMLAKKQFAERAGSLNKPRNLSATQQLSGSKGGVKREVREVENFDRESMKRDSVSSLASSESQFQQTKGILYSNKNIKAKSKLMDPLSIPVTFKK